MAILTYPLNGVLYDAEDVETYLCTRTSGVFSDDGHFPASVSGSRQITIGPGLAWMQNEEFHGKSVYNPEDVVLDIAEADAYYDRIDRIVLRFDKTINATDFEVLTGTPARNPVAPDIERDTLVYDLGLYTVTVKASTTSIDMSNVASTKLDESVCGLMEDAVTSIPTQELYDQWYAWFSNIQSDTEAFELQFNIWFQDIKDQAEAYIKENEEEFEDWRLEQQKAFDEWFDNLQYVLDGDVAGHLELEIEAAQNSADEALDQLITGTVTGWMTDELDGSGTPLLADDNDENYAITISRPICDNDSVILDVYPIGSIYMSVNLVDPANLFGGSWRRIEDCFLLAAGNNHEEGETGGSETVALTSSQIPSHTHSTPSHTHSIPSLSGTAASAGSHTHTVTACNGSSRPVAGVGSTFAAGADPTTITSSSSGSHTHSVTTNSSTTDSSSGTSGSTGSGQAHDNMPPYLTVYMWQRIA